MISRREPEPLSTTASARQKLSFRALNPQVVLCGDPEAGPEGWTAKLIDFGLAGPRSIASPRASPKPARRAAAAGGKQAAASAGSSLLSSLLDVAIDTRPGAVGTASFYGPET
eukprot:scaffold59617_cov79-Phaeocystis_antarctica.AAC.16